MTYNMPKIEGYDLTTDVGCRAAYFAARKYVVKASFSGSDAYPTYKAFDVEVRKMMARAGITEPTPQDWVKFAHKVDWGCTRCGRTGRFVTMIENGVPKGPGGQCYRCSGKGHQRATDAHRNYWHGMKRPVFC